MSDPIVIDTCALTDGNFRNWLRDYRGEKILPMVAYIECGLYWKYRNKPVEQLKEVLCRLRIDIQQFVHRHADKSIESLYGWKIRPNSDDYYKQWRDHAIAGHAHTAPIKLVTWNERDFHFLGTRVLTPQQAMRNL